MDQSIPSEFERELESLINRTSQENASHTPDFILAEFLMNALSAFNAATRRREEWYGRTPKGDAGTGPQPVLPLHPAGDSRE